MRASDTEFHVGVTIAIMMIVNVALGVAVGGDPWRFLGLAIPIHTVIGAIRWEAAERARLHVRSTECSGPPPLRDERIP